MEYLLNVQDALASNLDSLARKYVSEKRELDKKDAEIARLESVMKPLKKMMSAEKATFICILLSGLLDPVAT